MHTKVILVVFDGCRPDALARANTPAVDSLWKTGAYTWAAQTVTPSWSLPTHMSMFRGVSPEKHGVQDNQFQPSAALFPSIMDIAHEASLQTAMFYSWEELRDLSAHGSLDASYYRSTYSHNPIDQNIIEQASAYLVTDQPDLSFVYLCESDLVGHEHGWMSAPYLAAIERMDHALKCIIDALQHANLYEQFTWLVLADHGGHDHTHGTTAAEDITIPWILKGTGIKQGYALQTPVRIMDTPATIAHLLGLSIPAVWDGKPILDALHA